METTIKLKIANTLRTGSRYSLLIIGSVVLIFALISGSESFGGGIQGLLKNSPNALPWLLLIGAVVLSWKWELFGGIVVTLIGAAMLIYFNLGPNFFISTFILTLVIVVLGTMLTLSTLMRKIQ